MTIEEAIKARRSVRTFKDEALPEKDIAAILQAIENAGTLFGHRPDIRLHKFAIKGPTRPGTYGVINGASYYMMMAYGDSLEESVDAGFAMEQVVLEATRLGLGTCWMGGTFKASDFANAEKWPDGMALKIISPVGIPAERKRFIEKISGKILGSAHRKPFSDLFFAGDFGHPLPAGSPFAPALELLRLAPSSINAQPWRAVVVGDAVHFFKKGSRPLFPVDLGIGLCHFMAGVRISGIEGRFQRLQDSPLPLQPDLTYIGTFR